MGCSIKTPTRQQLKPSQTITLISQEVQTIKNHFDRNSQLLPVRIRDLFQKSFNNESNEVKTIDLKFISLSGIPLKSLEIILPLFSQLRTLDLWKTRLGNEGVKVIASLFPNFPLLTFLSLADNRIGLLGLVELTNGFCFLQGLETIQLHVNSFNDESTVLLAEKLPMLVKLKVLYLEECEMSGEPLRDLVLAMGSMKTLERVQIDYNQFDENLTGVLVGVIKKMNQLKRWSAKYCGIEGSTQESLRKIYPEILFSFT